MALYRLEMRLLEIDILYNERIKQYIFTVHQFKELWINYFYLIILLFKSKQGWFLPFI